MFARKLATQVLEPNGVDLKKAKRRRLRLQKLAIFRHQEAEAGERDHDQGKVLNKEAEVFVPTGCGEAWQHCQQEQIQYLHWQLEQTHLLVGHLSLQMDGLTRIVQANLAADSTTADINKETACETDVRADEVMQTEGEASEGVVCNRCHVAFGETGDTCWCFELLCHSCDKLALLCECLEPGLRMSTCLECGHTSNLPEYTLASLEEKGFKFACDDSSCALERNCSQCGATVVEAFCYVGEKDICGECKKATDQKDIIPCDSEHCCDEGGMYHSYCMTLFEAEGAYMCQPCLAAGRQLWCESRDVSDDESEVDDEHKTAECFEGLRVGMRLGEGRVSEIFPGIDKFTVEVATVSGGVEIRHHTISKFAVKMVDAQAAAMVMESVRPLILDDMD
eukprot:TRINITY_DN92288_c0_g1_i1.p1 TRINITY_DN92288_c0_g1~~TRINITY_DN92288_c0_g1_i1.p1  ORF type:complete len:418 (-),score=74.70 TRINITY_DN92288_c0_g1_i1:88-1269(-)